MFNGIVIRTERRPGNAAGAVMLKEVCARALSCCKMVFPWLREKMGRFGHLTGSLCSVSSHSISFYICHGCQCKIVFIPRAGPHATISDASSRDAARIAIKPAVDAELG